MEKPQVKTRKCGLKCEIWSRVCGYFRPVHAWNKGKKEEFAERKEFKIKSEPKENKKKINETSRKAVTEEEKYEKAYKKLKEATTKTELDEAVKKILLLNEDYISRPEIFQPLIISLMKKIENLIIYDDGEEEYEECGKSYRNREKEYEEAYKKLGEATTKRELEEAAKEIYLLDEYYANRPEIFQLKSVDELKWALDSHLYSKSEKDLIKERMNKLIQQQQEQKQEEKGLCRMI